MIKQHASSSRRGSISLIISIAAIVFSGPLISSVRVNGQSSGKTPLTHETMWMMKRVGAPNPSPDGKWVVFSLGEPA